MNQAQREMLKVIEKLKGDQVDLRSLVEQVRGVFESAFGRTSDAVRMRDLGKECAELLNAVSYRGRKEEAGDLLCSLLQFMAEQEIDPAEAVAATLTKIVRRQETYERYGDKIHVAIYGGAFDCITLGHEAVARAILEADRSTVDQVWFMPPYQYAGSKRLTDGVHRSAMCRLVADSDPRFRYFDFEVERRLCGKTIVAVRKLLESEFADMHRFSLVFGADAALKVPQYDEGDELLRLVPFVVTSRSGIDVPTDAWFRKEPHRFIQSTELPNISSSMVRALYAASATDPEALQKAAALVRPEVHAYILEHRLYGVG